MLRFRTTIAPFGHAAGIELTDEQAAALSPAKTPPVVVTVGDASERLRVSRMEGRPRIGLSKAARAALGIEIGDDVEVTVALDTDERTVGLPPALEAAIAAEPGLRERWDTLSYTRRKELAGMVADAKQAATRERRLASVLDVLRG